MANFPIQTQKNKLFQDILKKYLSAQLCGDRESAHQIIKKGLKTGLTLSEIYLKILTPSQHQIGTLWMDGKISVSEEHLATQITIEQLNFLKLLMVPKSPLGVSVVVTTLEGDWHFLGARILSDFLYEDGWNVDFLGASTPVEDLIAFIEKKHPQLVAISLTLETTLPLAKQLIERVKRLSVPPKILIGGYFFLQNKEMRNTLNADGFATEISSAIQEARKVCEIHPSPPSLQHFLKHLGDRIQKIRKERGMSQKELADASGLDRAYISSVEHGKQNVTIGAVIKLAEALEITLEEALVGAPTNNFGEK